MTEVSLHSILDTARKAIDAGEAERAIGMGQYVVHHAPTLIEGHRLLGEAYLNAGQPERAVGAFHEALRADPEHIGAFYGLGLAHQRLQQGLEAIRAFEAALEIQPNLAELRTQLLRLYTDTPGSTGQFRLSRSGLGRLYARGQMNGQAIDEFRAVLDDDPERDDVRVALAETLWRDGQEDEAMEWCRETIQRMPQLHKPTLILGYLQLAAGLPEGELLWRRATAQEPTLHTATQLFDILPPVEIEETRVPAYDAYAWQEQQRMAAAEAEQAAKDAEDAAGSNQATGTPAAIDRSAENELWASLEEPDATTGKGVGRTLVAEDALESPDADAEGQAWQRDVQTPGLSDDIVPFSFSDPQDETSHDELAAMAETSADIDDNLDEAAPFIVPAEAPAAQLPSPAVALATPPLMPLSNESALDSAAADDQALSDDDLLAQLLGFADAPENAPEQSMPEETPAAPALTARDAWSTHETDDAPSEPGASIEEFSFEAWQLEERTEPREPTLGAVQPFSLDLGDGDDNAEQEPADETGRDTMPFSLRELGLSDDELAASSTRQAAAEPVSPDLVTEENHSFSLADLGLQPEPSKALDDFTTFSLRDFEPQEEAEIAARIPSEPDDHESLQQQDETETSESGAVAIELPVWLRDDEPAVDAPVDEAELPQWMRSQFVPNDEAMAGATPAADQPVAPSDQAGINAEADIAPFSFADLGLDEADFTDLDLQGTAASAGAEPALTPFSLEDLEIDEQQRLAQEDTADEATRAELGLSDEELAQFEEEPTLDDSTDIPAATVVEPSVNIEPATTPDELADLGLSDEDLAHFEVPELDLDTNAQPAALPLTQSFDDDALVDFETLADTAALEGGEPMPAHAEPSIHDAETVPFDVADMIEATETSAPDEVTDETSALSEPLALDAPAVNTRATALPGQLSSLYERLETEPDNHAMRLAVARISEQMGEVERALDQYRQLIKHTALLEPVVEDLQDLVSGDYDRSLLRRAHRLLGDAYMKQERLDDAMNEYSWT